MVTQQPQAPQGGTLCGSRTSPREGGGAATFLPVVPALPLPPATLPSPRRLGNVLGPGALSCASLCYFQIGERTAVRQVIEGVSGFALLVEAQGRNEEETKTRTPTLISRERDDPGLQH